MKLRYRILSFLLILTMIVSHSGSLLPGGGTMLFSEVFAAEEDGSVIVEEAPEEETSVTAQNGSVEEPGDSGTDAEEGSSVQVEDQDHQDHTEQAEDQDQEHLARPQS